MDNELMQNQQAVRAVIETYFRGHASGDGSYFLKAFLPSAHVEGFRDGSFESRNLQAYAAVFKGAPAPDEAARTRTIDAIDVAGNAASAKATLNHGETIFTDYFVLLKVDGQWKIANKVYDRKARL